jgi:hypothetical protein
MSRKIRFLTVFAAGAVLLWAGVATRTAAASPIQDTDATPPEMSNFDVFLDGHADLARQLRGNPALVNSEEFLEDHPALQQYLANHPNLREELQESPSAFIKGSERVGDVETRRSAADRDRETAENGRADFDRAGFDAFFDSHPDIARELSKNPSLVNNGEFLEDHPALQQFLQAHPRLLAELKQNPQAMLRTPPPLKSRAFDKSDFDLFLDGHPEIARKLSRDPSLAGNPEFLEDHRTLQQFLQSHPELRMALRENPQSVMSTERRWESRETQGDVAGFDAFLDQHPQISRQLSSDPSLVRNPKYLQDHPELRQFLRTHPDLRAEVTENPNALMQSEQRWETREGDDVARGSGTAMGTGELSTFDAFLDAHPQVAEQLSKDPSLINNEEFLESHPALQDLLKQNPAIQQQFKQNPQAFVNAVRTENQHAARPEPKPLHPDPSVPKHSRLRARGTETAVPRVRSDIERRRYELQNIIGCGAGAVSTCLVQGGSEKGSAAEGNAGQDGIHGVRSPSRGTRRTRRVLGVVRRHQNHFRRQAVCAVPVADRHDGVPHSPSGQEASHGSPCGA